MSGSFLYFYLNIINIVFFVMSIIILVKEMLLYNNKKMFY